MYVIKRNGTRQEVHFEKITKRLQRLADAHDITGCDVQRVAQKVVEGMVDGVKTEDLDTEAAEIAISMGTSIPGFAKLGVCIAMSNLHKKTPKTFTGAMKLLHENKSVSDAFYECVCANAEFLNELIDGARDYDYEYIGIKTLEKSYLLKVKGEICERPQYMLLRAALALNINNMEETALVYKLLSKKMFTFATPTLFNAGTNQEQLSSCFLLHMLDDSIDGIFATLAMCAKISKTAGGIGLSLSNIRAKGAYIAGTNGVSNGLVPMFKVFEATARYVDQGGGKRKGSFAIYLEPWHADVEAFLDMKKTHGKDELRALDLFYALWTPDLFMKRVEADEKWSLFCPRVAPGLDDVYGDAFDALYTKYEEDLTIPRKTIRAQELWERILISQLETSGPYVLFKDACNRKSNQQNLGTIKGSNLCVEIVQFSSKDEVACCNLASLNLAKFVNTKTKTFEFQELISVARIVTRNLDKVIDTNYYPVPEARASNLRHRPIGLGVQGLADVFALMRMPYDSPEAYKLNRDIFETIYFAACSESIELAEKRGAYQSFKGSPFSKGQFQFDLWDVKPELYDWEPLRQRMMKTGMGNSLLTTCMPTASTSSVLGGNEGMEPFSALLYSRATLAGDFVLINKHLVSELQRLGLWDEMMKQRIIYHRGSIQNIASIPDDTKAIFKTAYEMSQRTLIKQSADRGPYIDQSQSLNIFMKDANMEKLTGVLFNGWKMGLKTGLYYLHQIVKQKPIQFTIPDTMRAVFEAEMKELTAVPPPKKMRFSPEAIKQCQEESEAEGGACTLCSS